MSPALKFRAGAELFEDACRWTLAGIAAQFPPLDDAGRRAELRRRLTLAERAQDKGKGPPLR